MKNSTVILAGVAVFSDPGNVAQAMHAAACFHSLIHQAMARVAEGVGHDAAAFYPSAGVLDADRTARTQ